MVVRDLRVKEQGSCEAGEQKGQRVSSPHGTLPQSFDGWPKPLLSMYMADCWPYPRPLFQSGSEQCKTWRWEERLTQALISRGSRPQPCLHFLFSFQRVFFFFNKEKSKFYTCVLHKCTCLNMSIYITMTCGYHTSSYHLSHIYPSLTKRITNKRFCSLWFNISWVKNLSTHWGCHFTTWQHFEKTTVFPLYWMNICFHEALPF